MLKITFSWFQRSRLQYRIFICLTVVDSEVCEITRYSVSENSNL